MCAGYTWLEFGGDGDDRMSETGGPAHSAEFESYAEQSSRRHAETTLRRDWLCYGEANRLKFGTSDAYINLDEALLHTLNSTHSTVQHQQHHPTHPNDNTQQHTTTTTNPQSVTMKFFSTVILALASVAMAAPNAQPNQGADTLVPKVRSVLSPLHSSTIHPDSQSAS